MLANLSNMTATINLIFITLKKTLCQPIENNPVNLLP